jgi:hypothetical protein
MTKLADTDSDPVNDSGTGRDGTRVDETWYNAFVTAIDALIHSTNNPTITPADTIDEVVDARGSIGTLDGRIDVEHNEDGTHKNTGIIATFITEAQLMGGLGGVNLIRNDDFLSWPDGDSAAPVYWALTGAGASVARTGTGLGDTNRKIGDFAGKVTRAGTNCYLENILLDGTAFTRADFLRTKYIAIGVWVKCSTPNIARVAVYDGIGTSYSSYHTGGGATRPTTPGAEPGSSCPSPGSSIPLPRKSRSSAMWTRRTGTPTSPGPQRSSSTMTWISFNTRPLP